MPCYTVRTYEVEAGKMNLDLLTKGLKAIGWNAWIEAPQQGVGACVRFSTPQGAVGYYSAATGRATLPEGVKIEQVKVAYARAAVGAAAQRMGWRVAATAQTNKLVMTRRQS